MSSLHGTTRWILLGVLATLALDIPRDLRAQEKATRGAIKLHEVDDTTVQEPTAEKAERVSTHSGGKGKVVVTLSSPVYKVGESLAVTVFSDTDCFIRVVQFGADGSTTQLLPNAFQKGNKIKAGETIKLPDTSQSTKHYGLFTSEPTGREKVVVFVSEKQFGDKRSLNVSEKDQFLALERSEVVNTRGVINIKAEEADDGPAAEVVAASITYDLKSP